MQQLKEKRFKRRKKKEKRKDHNKQIRIKREGKKQTSKQIKKNATGIRAVTNQFLLAYIYIFLFLDVLQCTDMKHSAVIYL